MSKESSLELKVGLLVVAALVVLSGFVLVLGGMRLEKTKSVFVEFDNPGALQAGAAVRIGGAKIGKVSELEFRGHSQERQAHEGLIRAKIDIAAKVLPTLHDDATFYVTTQAVLGEPFLAVEPGTPGRPPIVEGSVLRGLDPPRIDLFLAKAYELLDSAVDAIRTKKGVIGQLADDSAAIVHTARELTDQNKDRFAHTIENVDKLSGDAVLLAEDARKRLNDPRIDRVLERTDTLTASLQKDAPALVSDARSTLATVKTLLDATAGTEADREKIKKAMKDAEEILAKGNAMASDGQALLANVKKGKGTVGAMLVDDALYDDLQTLVRDLKRNPWKFLWKD
jgi:phospholipid/cholesterol/gamma-HCH transport system substrate-binding protein